MSDIVERPTGSNADEWNLFLSEWLRVEAGRVCNTEYLAVQIAEALDAYWQEYLAERAARMEANSREANAAAEITRLRDELAKAVPAGYVVVPKEPNLAMQNEFEAVYFREYAAGPDECFTDNDPFYDAYRAMIAAGEKP